MIFLKKYYLFVVERIYPQIILKKKQVYIFLKNITFGKGVTIAVIIFGIFHLFCFWFPFTDNAFVVTNVSPIAADVSGFITNIYVKNGQLVKKVNPSLKFIKNLINGLINKDLQNTLKPNNK
jgi:hypothetical protein